MYNCWNEALEYLIKKYGERYINGGMITIGNRKTGTKPINTSRKERTYKTENIQSEDKVIVLLMGQYYYGIQAKKELYYKLVELGEIN